VQGHQSGADASAVNTPPNDNGRPVPPGTRRTRRELLALALAAIASSGPLAACAVPRAVAAQSPAVSPSAPPPSLSPAPSAALAEVAAGNSSTASTAASAPPNVLLVTVDALRADQLGVYGHPFVKTPALDRLAAQGARFTSHMVQEPQTDPSHASLFSGMYPSSNGVRVHMVDKLPDSLDTMATLYSKAGYATAGLFSWMSLEGQFCNLQRGFGIYTDLTASLPTPTPTSAGEPAQSPKGRADRTTDAAIAQLRAFGNRPFFLWLHYFDCHSPYDLPSAALDEYDPGYRGSIQGDPATVDALRAGQLHPSEPDIIRLMSMYQAEITYLDSQISRLFAALDAMQLTQNTILAVTADHGESFAEHGEFIVGGDFFHPCGLYNPEGRAPLLLRYPPSVRPGTVVEAPTQAIDLLPTLLEMTGLPASPQAQGASMVGLLNGSDDGAQRVAYASMPDYVFTALTTQHWKLIQNNATGEHRLYNRSRDPAEQLDQLAVQPEVGTQLTGQLQSWMKAVKISS
jgi:arylsulfatase